MTLSSRLKKLALVLRRNVCDRETAARYKRKTLRDRKLKRDIRYKLVRVLPSLTVRMDGTKNHHRPHIHCKIGERNHAASIAIDNGEILAGRLTPIQRKEVQAWVSRHRKALNNLWKEMQAGKPVEALICKFKTEYF